MICKLEGMRVTDQSITNEPQLTKLICRRGSHRAAANCIRHTGVKIWNKISNILSALIDIHFISNLSALIVVSEIIYFNKLDW